MKETALVSSICRHLTALDSIVTTFLFNGRKTSMAFSYSMALKGSIVWPFISFFVAFLVWLIISRNRSSKSRPPGPPGYPLIGNIFDVGMMPHYNLYKLRAKYGPVLWVKLGMKNALVVQSPKAVEELFKKHDLLFSDRFVPDSLTACDYNKGSLANARYSEYWKVIRKLSSSELFMHKRIVASAPVRGNCVDIMIKWINEDAEASRGNGGTGEIKFDKYLSLMTFNLVSNFLISKEIMGLKSGKGEEFYEAMNKFMEWSGVANLVDSFPFLKWIDPQRIRKNTKKYMRKLLNIVDEFVKERIQEKKLGKQRETKDFLDSLLDYKGKGEITEISEKNVSIIVLEMFFGGTETTSSTITWGMAELLRKPELLNKVQDELDVVIGRSRKVEEDDLNNLLYLQAVVKETMRLHPSLPFLLPRNAMQDTEFMGYQIPKDTTVLLNVWAIHRDPDVWDDPLSFKPERFINTNIDSKGQHYELIPFGSGRRSCIGMFLGDKMVALTLARLIQSFNWKLPSDDPPHTLDMREQTGISLRKLVPLTAIPEKRTS